jgi:hypothetical protein
MPKQDAPLTGEALIKEVCRRIRVARSYIKLSRPVTRATRLQNRA